MVHAMDLTNQLDVTPTFECICVLEEVIKDRPLSPASSTASSGTLCMNTTNRSSCSTSPITSGGCVSNIGRTARIVKVKSNTEDSEPKVPPL